MRILVLGGTAFLGRAIATDALQRGHAVTCLARGNGSPPAGAAFVAADRDDVEGLAAVRSEQWDAVVDVSRQPGQVCRAVRELATSHWVFVSSSNVYADFSATEQDETAATLEPLDGDVMESMQTYGAAKVACENAVRTSGGSATIVRSGLIGGPGDVTGRSGYWPWRFAHPTADDVIVPDDAALPCALIDVRDLASWIVTAAHQRIDGTFNATGPTTTLGDVLALSRDVAHSAAALRPVSADQLGRLGVASWMGPKSLPLWIDEPSWRGFATLDTRRARAAGLETRPLRETLSDVLDYENAREAPRQAGLTDDDERAIRRSLSTT
jgi:nucleoside-diphosphate-sugar epimerase